MSLVLRLLSECATLRQSTGFVEQSGSSFGWEVLFTGQRWDAGSGLYLFRMRVYCAGVGVFVQRDPLTDINGASTYCAYFVPSFVDPFGQELVAPWNPRAQWWFGLKNPRAINKPKRNAGFRLPELTKLIASFVPPRIGVLYKDWRIGVFPLPVAPGFTIEAYFFVDVSVQECCKRGGKKGVFLSGVVGFEINGGVGTSIGGTSGIRAKRHDKRVRAGQPKGSGGRYTSYYYAPGKAPSGHRGATHKPVYGHHPDAGRTAVRHASGVGTQSLPSCPPRRLRLTGTLDVGASGFVTAGLWRTSVGATFDVPILHCAAPGWTCKYIDPLKNSSANVVFGLGSGARIQAYGRYSVHLDLRLL